MGILISNSVPRLLPFVSAWVHIKSPPNFLAMPLATINPNPSPSELLVILAFSCEKGLNSFGRKLAGIPGPLSLTLMERHLPRSRMFADTATFPSARSVNLRALSTTQDMSFVRSFSSTNIVVGTMVSMLHSMSFCPALPSEPRVRTSMTSPSSVS